MADNFPVIDGAGATRTVRTTDNAGVHTPHSDAELWVNGAAVDTSNPVPVRAGVAAADLGKAEDAAHVSGDTGVMALGVRKDTPSALASTDGDYQPPIFDSLGRQHVNATRGATNITVAQVTTSTTHGTLAIARATRRTITIKNTDAAITVYIGPATVTSANGFPLLAGESITLTWIGLIDVIAASGTPVVVVVDEYD